MKHSDHVEVAICGGQDFIRSLVSDIGADPSNVEVRTVNTEKDETRLAFDVGTIATAVLIIQGAYYVSHLAEKILTYAKKCQARTISIRTPFNEVTLSIEDDLTVEAVKRYLRRAADMMQ